MEPGSIHITSPRLGRVVQVWHWPKYSRDTARSQILHIKKWIIGHEACSMWMCCPLWSILASYLQLDTRLARLHPKSFEFYNLVQNLNFIRLIVLFGLPKMSGKEGRSTGLSGAPTNTKLPATLIRSKMGPRLCFADTVSSIKSKLLAPACYWFNISS